MEDTLRNILGFKISKPFKELEKVGDLLYYDGPLTSVFKDSDNCPFIYDWVESDDEVNRWLLYQTEDYLLSDYIFKRISHLQLLQSPKNDIVFVVDMDSHSNITQCLVISPQNIPYDYLPRGTSMFEEEDSVDLSSIVSTFNLHKEKPREERNFDILSEAKKYNSELINLHFKSKNSKVGFGKINSSILGDVLSQFHDLSEATAINIFDRRGDSSDDKIKRKRGELKNIKELAEFEYVYAKAASFSVFLRPIKRTVNLFTDETSSETILKQVFQLFEASTDIDSLQEMGKKLSKEMLTTYNTFLRGIKEKDISLTVQYASPVKGIKLSDKFDLQKSNKILNNLDILEYQNTEQIKVQGNFTALDKTNNSFKFEDNEGSSYSGKFSNQLMLGISTFNLQNLYMVTFEVLKEKKSGQKDAKEKNTIVACINLD